MNTTILERYRTIVDWPDFVASLAEPLPTCIVANTLRISRAELVGRLDRRNVGTRVLPWTDDALVLERRNSPGVRFEYMTGLYNVQEEAAVIPVKILDPQPGERVLDLCAAPGNKTAQIAIAMQNRGTVVANDRSAGRMRATRSVLDRLGLANVCLTLGNGMNFPNAVGTFDRVLVDVPCSCEGTSRKQDGVLQQAPAYEKLANVQRALLRRALELCEPGGRVVYSTCTYAPEENEEVVDDVIRELGFDVEWVECRLPAFDCAPGLTSWNGRQFDPRMERAMRVWPHLNDTGGFFVAAFDKSPDARVRYERPDPGETFTAVDPEPWLAPLRARFGWSNFDDWMLFAPNKKTLCLASADIQPPVGVGYAGMGIGFLRKAMAIPKITTAGAMLFGPQTTSGALDLGHEEMNEFLRRHDVEVPVRDGGDDYVLVRCEGTVAGVGRYRGDSRVVESLYPGAWSLGDDASAFEDET